jgi:hypothetical protein
MSPFDVPLANQSDPGNGMLADRKVAKCHSVGSHLRTQNHVSFQIRYRDPTTQQEHDLKIDSDVSVGRDPSANGLAVSSASLDFTISSDAVHIYGEQDRVVVHNTSSYAHLEVTRPSGSLQLAPDEKLVLAETATVIIPGEAYGHEITITPPHPTNSEKSAGSTRSLIPEGYQIPDERREVLAHLCAPLYYPHRFSSNQTAREIATRIKRNGQVVSAREVNNKIQRTKDAVEEKCLTELATRQELAAYLVEHQLVTKHDVDTLILLM